MSELREDILYTLTGDSYGEELHVDNKAKYIADDIEKLLKNFPQLTDKLCYNCDHKTFVYDNAYRCIYCGTLSAITTIREKGEL